MDADNDRTYLMKEIVRVRGLLEGRASDVTPYSGDPPALARLVLRFELSAFERDLLLLCTDQALGSFARVVLTFRHALARLPGAELDALAPTSPLRSYRLLVIAGDDPLSSPLVLDERVFYFLLGIPALDERLAVHLVVHVDQIFELTSTHRTIADELGREIESPSPTSVFQVFGGGIASRAAVVNAAIQAAHLVPMRVRAATLPSSASEIESLARARERELQLAGRLLVIEVDDDDPTQQRIVDTLAAMNRGVFVVSARERLVLRGRSVSRELQPPTLAERVQAWRDALGERVVDAEPGLDRLAHQFALEPQQIAEVVHSARSASNFVEALWSGAKQVARPQLAGLATNRAPMASWGDLVLPASIEGVLREIGDQLRHRHKVHEVWGVGRRGRGTAITALFHGPSGTGKTLAAEVIARETGLDLYRVDLSQVVDKYVGETEKRLSKIFDAADQTGSILLFDEADALFGKRGEVERGTDRWANLEVSYLLQRMETYRGLAILTSNAKDALDSAFLRRLRFVVAFPFPAVQERAEIWRRAFPPTAPVTQLDSEKLARLQLTGANIHNVAVRAAFFAARDNTAITTAQIIQAARGEFTKLQIPFPEAEIRSWGLA
ncbi:MAG: ATP-binding protein [Kofleriaceae bacterium]